MKNLFCYLFSWSRSWTEQEKLNWQEIKKKGALRFILKEGVLKWGILSLTIFLIATYRTFTANGYNQTTFLLLTALIWLVASIIYGFLVWKGSNISYAQHTNKHNGSV